MSFALTQNSVLLERPTSLCLAAASMETSKTETDTEQRDKLRKKVVEDTGGILSYFWPLHPIRLFIDLVLAALRLIQPLAPQLVPLAVFSVSLPLIIFLSLGSGYWVWKSVAVGWETEIFLQYGYVSPVYLLRAVY